MTERDALLDYMELEDVDLQSSVNHSKPREFTMSNLPPSPSPSDDDLIDAEKQIRSSHIHPSYKDSSVLDLDAVPLSQLSNGGPSATSGNGNSNSSSENLSAFKKGATSNPTEHDEGVEVQQTARKYADFHTIDWLRDIAKDRIRHRHIMKKRSGNLYDKMSSIIDAASGWFCAFIVGVTVGTIAGVIDIATPWFNDLKYGICKDTFWLNREQCCWDSENNTKFHGEISCEQWQDWWDLFGIERNNSAGIYVFSYFIYTVIAICFAVITAVGVKMFAPYASGSGLAEIKTMLSGFVIHGYLGKWTLLLKSTGLMLSVAAGLSLGKEGPMVHIACCVGNIVSYLFPKYRNNEAKKREVLSAAAAAGVSVGFGAPVGGVLFSLEEASYYFPMKTLWRSFFCALVAAFVLRSINPFGNNHLVLFYINYKREWFLIELIPFMIIGAIGGVIGAIYIKGNIAWCRRRKTTKQGQYPILEVLLVVTITSLVCYPIPYTRKNTSELIRQLVSSCSPEDSDGLCDYVNRTVITTFKGTSSAPMGEGMKVTMWLLALSLILRIVLTIFTIGIKVPAGIFIPSLGIGAIMGRIVGMGMEQIALYYKETSTFQTMCRSDEPCVEPGLYAMIGAAAVLGGITRMTVSLVVIMFELTGGLQYIVPLMAATMVSKWVADSLVHEGIDYAHIMLNQYPFLDNKEEFTHTSLAADCMVPQRGEPPLRVLTQDGMTVADLDDLLKTTKFNGFPVVVSKESQYLVGFVERRDLEYSISNAKARTCIQPESKVFFTPQYPANINSGGQPTPLKLRKIVDLAPITVTDQTPMETVFEMFRKLGLRYTLVTHYGRVLGVITKKDILRHVAYLENKRGVVHIPAAHDSNK